MTLVKIDCYITFWMENENFNSVYFSTRKIIKLFEFTSSKIILANSEVEHKSV
jgi:hypothetical protein